MLVLVVDVVVVVGAGQDPLTVNGLSPKLPVPGVKLAVTHPLKTSPGVTEID